MTISGDLDSLYKRKGTNITKCIRVSIKGLIEKIYNFGVKYAIKLKKKYLILLPFSLRKFA